MTLRFLVSLLVPLLLSMSGCADVVVAGGPPHGHSGRPYQIPPGHMPPPGQCRIWYPDVPPGQQPPPGNCHDLEYRVPANAYLVYGD